MYSTISPENPFLVFLRENGMIQRKVPAPNTVKPGEYMNILSTDVAFLYRIGEVIKKISSEYRVMAPGTQTVCYYRESTGITAFNPSLGIWGFHLADLDNLYQIRNSERFKNKF